MKTSEILKIAEVFYLIAAKKPSAGFLFYCPDGTVLLTKRSDDMSKPETWSLPGGRAIDEDRSPMETAKREAEEEIDVIPEKKKLINKHIIERNKKNYIVYIYEISSEEKKNFSSKIRLDKESQNYKWFKVNQLPKNTHLDLNWIKDKLFSI